ncbi:hypothetical protein ACL02R_07260 [Streptomyces sp. MS19]|uniref:hypothetical protein n=1 Tax=Streptomyces sp. MS19 TaxID=3385972 RepID=UPI0039A30FC1
MRIPLALAALATGAAVAVANAPAAGAATATAVSTGIDPVFTDSPLPPGDGGQLLGSEQVGPWTTWAFGMHRSEGTRDTPLLYSYDARSEKGWEEVALPPAGGRDSNNEINDAAVVPGSAGEDAWLVGLADLGADADVLTMHLSGGTWQTLRAPLPPKAESGGFSAVSALAADDVWAVGWAEIVDSRVPDPRKPGGEIVTSHVEAVLEHWDGTAWRLADLPDAAGLTVSSLLTPAPGELWIGGWDADGDPAVRHLEDGAWTSADLPDLPGEYGELYGLTAGPDGTLWATGRSFAYDVDWQPDDNGDRALVLRRTGGTWERVATPASAGRVDDIVVTAGGITAVGERYDNHSGFLLRLRGDSWSTPALPPAGPGHRWFNGISADPDGRLTVVGATADAETPWIQQPLVLNGWS